MISKLSSTLSQWDKTLNEVVYAISNTVSRSTNEIPTILLYGIKQQFKYDDEIKKYLDSINFFNERDLEKVRQQASDYINKVQQQNKDNYDGKHKLPKDYIVGDLVLISNSDVTPNVNKKLIPKFKGPYIIKKVLPNDRFVVTDVPRFQLTQKPYEGIISVGNMKMWSTNPENNTQ